MKVKGIQMQIFEKNSTEPSRPPLEACPIFQQALGDLNRHRTEPRFPTAHWKEDLLQISHLSLAEAEWIESERLNLQEDLLKVPRKPRAFMEWFSSLVENGPGQNDPLFDWLAETADLEQMRWFIRQEVAGEAGFEDLTALTQIRFPTQPKLEMARNYWDEMGKGREAGMHGPMLSALAQEMGLEGGEASPGQVVPEALALGNLMMALAANRRYAFQSVGALGVIELTAPGRAEKVSQGLRRLGLSKVGQTYYALHAVVDLKHSADWNREVLEPLATDDPRCILFLAEGALLRLRAGARCFHRYRQELGLRLWH